MLSVCFPFLFKEAIAHSKEKIPGSFSGHKRLEIYLLGSPETDTKIGSNSHVFCMHNYNKLAI